MSAARLLLLLFTVALGLGPGRPARAPSLTGEVVRLVADPVDEPAHPSASARLPLLGVSARPPTSGPTGEGRPALPVSEPAARHAKPVGRPGPLVFRPAGWRNAPDRPPYYPTAPPARSSTVSIV